MKDFAESRREFLKTTGAVAGAFLLYPRGIRRPRPRQSGSPRVLYLRNEDPKHG